MVIEWRQLHAGIVKSLWAGGFVRLLSCVLALAVVAAFAVARSL
jgi:hypothetical protein